MPNFGEIITKAIVTKIYKKPGDFVSSEDIIADIETEKVNLEIKSHYEGFITEINVIEGEEVDINKTIFQIATNITKMENKSPIAINKVKMSKLRSTISERLKYAQNTAAIVTTFNEIDMSNVIIKRQEYKKSGLKIGISPFFIKAASYVLPHFAGVNAQIEGEYIIYKKYYNIGLALDIEDGLFISVIQDADKKNIAEIAKTIEQIINKTNKQDLTAEDAKNGTFTVTNGGKYGSLFSTPIINPPQAGILGINTIMERPIALNGEVVIKPMMYISLSYDHRIIDGKEAIGFLKAIRMFLENFDNL